MQGQLRNEWVSVEIETTCQHCHQRLQITIDSAMAFSVRQPAAAPLLFMPELDWEHFSERTIIDSY